MGFGHSILLRIILQAFLSSADIFQKIPLKFYVMFANVINMCQLMANFTACCNTADNLFKEFKSTKFWA